MKRKKQKAKKLSPCICGCDQVELSRTLASGDCNFWLHTYCPKCGRTGPHIPMWVEQAEPHEATATRIHNRDMTIYQAKPITPTEKRVLSAARKLQRHMDEVPHPPGWVLLHTRRLRNRVCEAVRADEKAKRKGKRHDA